MLVEVARRLFTEKSVVDTTMNDIAVASGKGRRTLYTYFSSKEDIYMACIESELQIASGSLQAVIKMPLEPEEKVKTFIKVHFETFKDMVIRNGNLRGQFFRDITEVEKVRRKLDRKEMVMLVLILSEGQEKGVFEIKNLKNTAQVLQYCLKGLEVPYIRQSVAKRKEQIQNIFDLISLGINKRETEKVQDLS